MGRRHHMCVQAAVMAAPLLPRCPRGSHGGAPGRSLARLLRCRRGFPPHAGSAQTRAWTRVGDRALLSLAALLSLVVPLASACAESGASQGWDGGSDAAAVIDAARTPTGKLDMLFMLANGGGSYPQRLELATHIPDLMEQLGEATEPLDLHVGIVSSSLGAPLAEDLGGCVPGGDQGMLQNTPQGRTCGEAYLIDSGDRFLRYAEDPDGGPSATNFTGDLSAAFECLGAGTIESCRFEHQLESVRMALDGCGTAAGCTQPANEDFLRPDAVLAIILLGNHDDCSAPASTTLFDPSQSALDSPLGPLTPYRCFEFGVVCGGAPPGRDPGPRTDCVPGTPDADPRHQLVPLADYAVFLKGLKPDPRMVYLGVIAPIPAPITVVRDPNGGPALQSFRCFYSAMMPGIRLARLTTLFDHDRARFFSCAEPPGATMRTIGSNLATILGR